MSKDLYHPIPEVMRDLCHYFGFGCGFIYQSDHTANFYLLESYTIYDNSALNETVNLHDTLGDELMHQLALRPAVVFKKKHIKDALEEKLCELFSVNSMVMVPVTDENRRLVAFVGIADRRGASRTEDDDFEFTYTLLSAVANHIKLQFYQRRVEASRKALESMVDNMGIDVYVNDFETHEILYVNRSMAEPYGGVENLMGKPCWQALYEGKMGQCDFCPQKKLTNSDGRPSKAFSWDYQRPFDGAWFRVFSAAFQWLDGRLAHVVSSVDITENKRNEALVRDMAEKDILTGLPNRRKLIEDCDRMKETLESGFMIFFDLDGFKAVNDTLGHRAGDELLERIGCMLQANPLTYGKSYRNGGDEFVLICRNHTLEQLLLVTDYLQGSFSKPWHLRDGEAFCPTSIGVTEFPVRDETTDNLLHRADTAMYHAKRCGKGLIHFNDNGRILTREEYCEKHAGQE